MNTNKKLALNKQIMANLDGQAMSDVKGGGIFSLQKWCSIVYETITELIHASMEHCFSGDPKGLCETDLCTFICETNGCQGTEYNSCYGGSCGKCG